MSSAKELLRTVSSTWAVFLSQLSKSVFAVGEEIYVWTHCAESAAYFRYLAEISVLCSACVRLSYLVYNLNISHNHSLQQYLITESVQLLCLTHTLCGQSVFSRGETLLKTLPSRAGHETQCGSGSQRNDFQHWDYVTRLWSWMWSLPYVRGTRAFKGNRIPPLPFLRWHFPPHTGLKVYIWFRPEIPPVQWTQREQFSS